MSRATPCQRISTTLGTFGNVANEINCGKFHVDGWRNLIFAGVECYIFLWPESEAVYGLSCMHVTRNKETVIIMLGHG
jgi:hypothetical protein